VLPSRSHLALLPKQPRRIAVVCRGCHTPETFEHLDGRVSVHNTPLTDWLLETNKYAPYLSNNQEAIAQLRAKEHSLAEQFPLPENLPQRVKRLRLAFANKGRPPDGRTLSAHPLHACVLRIIDKPGTLRASASPDGNRPYSGADCELTRALHACRLLPQLLVLTRTAIASGRNAFRSSADGTLARRQADWTLAASGGNLAAGCAPAGAHSSSTSWHPRNACLLRAALCIPHLTPLSAAHRRARRAGKKTKIPEDFDHLLERASSHGTPILDWLLETNKYAAKLKPAGIDALRAKEHKLAEAFPNDLRERVRRMRISIANKNRSPWNLGKPHKPGAPHARSWICLLLQLWSPTTRLAWRHSCGTVHRNGMYVA
jgi:hypothetical protein